LIRATDRSKDQSYVLHVLSQDQLSKAVFPIGDLQKSDVRTLARDHDLPVADRQDSQDLCFLGSMDYRDFLKLEGSDLLDPGPIVKTNGEQIGTHSGLASYTIGQRKGIGISANEPYYVIEKDRLQNTLVVGHRGELGRTNFEIGDMNWIQNEIPIQRDELDVQVRYKTKPVRARIEKANDGSINVTLTVAIMDITPGQWAVFYDQEVCLGGGMILP
jgi:tRNA-specific 2-thiouridylase